MMKLLSLCIFISSLALSQDTRDKVLHLSAEQKMKMKEYKAEMKACKEENKMKILSILNDEQKIKFLQLRQERKKKKSKQKNINIQKVDVKN